MVYNSMFYIKGDRVMMNCDARIFFDDDTDFPFPWSDDMGGSAPTYDPYDEFYGGSYDDPNDDLYGDSFDRSYDDSYDDPYDDSYDDPYDVIYDDRDDLWRDSSCDPVLAELRACIDRHRIDDELDLDLDPIDGIYIPTKIHSPNYGLILDCSGGIGSFRYV